MLQRLIFFALLTAACLNTGCERDAFITLPHHQPALVVHGYIETGELFQVSVGKTFSADQGVLDDSTYVETAQAVLYENNIIVDTLDYNPLIKRYSSSTARAVPGREYKLVVSAPGFKTVEATTYAPHPVPLTSVVYRTGTSTDVTGGVLDDIIFRFNDAPGEKNYYLANLRAGYFWGNFTCVYTYDPSVEKNQAGTDPFEVSNCIQQNEIMYADRLFNGTLKELKLSVDASFIAISTDPSSGRKFRPHLKTYHVTEEYYRYFRARISLNTSGTDPFASPISIKGNVRNGYGLFTVMGASADTLK